MDMMTRDEHVTAFIVNTADYPWEIYPDYKVSRKEAYAVCSEVLALRQIIKEAKEAMNAMAADETLSNDTLSDIGCGIGMAHEALCDIEKKIMEGIPDEECAGSQNA